MVDSTETWTKEKPHEPDLVRVHVGSPWPKWPKRAPSLILFDGKIFTYEESTALNATYHLPLRYNGLQTGLRLTHRDGVVKSVVGRLSGHQGLRSGNRRYLSRR